MISSMKQIVMDVVANNGESSTLHSVHWDEDDTMVIANNLSLPTTINWEFEAF